MKKISQLFLALSLVVYTEAQVLGSRDGSRNSKERRVGKSKEKAGPILKKKLKSNLNLILVGKDGEAFEAPAYTDREKKEREKARKAKENAEKIKNTKKEIKIYNDIFHNSKWTDALSNIDFFDQQKRKEAKSLMNGFRADFEHSIKELQSTSLEFQWQIAQEFLDSLSKAKASPKKFIEGILTANPGQWKDHGDSLFKILLVKTLKETNSFKNFIHNLKKSAFQAKDEAIENPSKVSELGKNIDEAIRLFARIFFPKALKSNKRVEAMEDLGISSDDPVFANDMESFVSTNQDGINARRLLRKKFLSLFLDDLRDLRNSGAPDFRHKVSEILLKLDQDIDDDQKSGDETNDDQKIGDETNDDLKIKRYLKELRLGQYKGNKDDVYQMWQIQNGPVTGKLKASDIAIQNKIYDIFSAIQDNAEFFVKINAEKKEEERKERERSIERKKIAKQKMAEKKIAEKKIAEQEKTKNKKEALN